MQFEGGQVVHQQTPEGRRTQSMKNFSPGYRQQVITRIVAYLAQRGAARSDTVSGNPADIERYLRVLMPDFSIEITERDPHYRLTRIETDEPVGNADQLSSGEAQVLTLGLDIVTMAASWALSHQEERVLLLDEPDAHMHPDLQVRFADFIVQVMGKYECQVLIATHSPTLLAALGQFGGDKASVIYMDRTRSEFVAVPYGDALKETAAVLGGHLLMGPLFGAPILLVEGEDDYRIWSQVPRHHVINLAVLPCNGEKIKKYQKALETVLSALCDKQETPHGYALLDGDKNLPEPNPDNPQDYIKFLQLNCHEAENLYLTDEALADLGTEWEAAKAKVHDEAPNFGQKEQQLREAPNWDRQNADLKEVIDQVAQILDPKNVPWTVRVGHRIGRERPTGQLADFLGPDVISALWGSKAATDEAR